MSLRVYQAEWCPYSSAVRQALTELGLEWTAMPVEPDREDRDELERVAGTRAIPVVVLEDGTTLAGDTADTIEVLRERFGPGAHAAGHHRQAEAHGTVTP